MAHLVEQMAYVGRTPWHGLGNQLSPDQPLEVWSKQAGMDWRILESPVQFISSQAGTLKQIAAYEEHKVLFRSDTLAPLSVVGHRYKVVQPGEILEFYRDLTEKSGFELETVGVLKGGKKLWALAKTGQATQLKGLDLTKGYVLLATACDGTMATTAQFTSVRVVCNNTLAVAVSDSAGAVKVPHRSVFEPEQVKKQLGISVSAWDDFMYRMKLLSARKVSNQESRDYLRKIFLGPTSLASAKAGERNIETVLELFNGKGMGANLSTADGTAYGLLNAVTQFVDHERRAHNQDNRLDSAWFGQGAVLKSKAMNQALLLAA